MSGVVRFSNDIAVFEKAQRLFENVHAELEVLLPDADIQHVGSTAIPGSLTKGDLDIVIRVLAEGFARADAVLADRFARNAASERSNDLAAFSDASSDPALGVQLVAIGGSADTFLAWRDLLRSDSDLRRQYDELKASYDGKPMDAYRAAKAAFIEEQLGA